jgi:hypothetical protein
MTGFGEIRPLPGIWDSLHIDTAVTLPVGVEAYAAFALRAWLTSDPVISDRTRRFARWSAIAALVLGMVGQVAYHLLAQAGVTRAPWEVTTAVACLPVLVLGMGTALAHLLRADASATGQAARAPGYGPEATLGTAVVPGHWPGDYADQRRGRTGAGDVTAGGTPGPLTGPCDAATVRHDPVRHDPVRPPAPGTGTGRVVNSAMSLRMAEAYAAADRLARAGQRISRRSLRAAGLHGSNADLGMLAGLVRSSLAGARHIGGP